MPVALVGSWYRAASHVTIEHHRLEWPTFARALRALRGLRDATSAVGATFDLDELLAELWNWSYKLTGSPVSPTDAGTGAMGIRIRTHLTSGRDTRHAAALEEVASLLDVLAVEEHPAAPVLEDVISRYGAEPGDPPAVYIAARHDGAALMERWLKTEELDAEVRTVTQLKTADVRQALVLLGSPSRFYLSTWCPLSTAARVGGWLLAAPPAEQVHVITWPGHPPLEAARAALLPSTTARPVVVTVTSRAATPAAPEVQTEPVWLPPLPVDEEIPAASWAMDKEPVSATGLRLAGDAVSFFHQELGPRPQAVTWDVGAVDVADVAARTVRPGQVLLFRPDRSATDDELHRRAGALLAEKYGPEAPNKALAAKQELKDALRTTLRTKTHQQLVYELRSKLNDEQYARHILNRLPDPDYIAPEKAGAYPALRRVLGLYGNDDQYRWVRALRGALRRAGHEVTNELVDVLTSTTTWQATVEATGVATIAGGEEVGCLELRVVTAVDPAQKKVGRSRLGRLLPDPTAATRSGS